MLKILPKIALAAYLNPMPKRPFEPCLPIAERMFQPARSGFTRSSMTATA
jgi:hypothetical protein